MTTPERRLQLQTLVTPLAPAFLLCALLARPAAATPITYTVDFIADGSRSAFNGFESIPNDGTYYTGGPGPYTEDGISVTQVNGDAGNDIWLTFFSPEGNYGWYPNGGDHGYTRITLLSGDDFNSVGLLRSTGSNFGTLFYELYQNSILVSAGFVPQPANGQPAYLGWSGGGFDEIRLRDDCGGLDVCNAVAIDAIETAPEPATLFLFGFGLLTITHRIHRQLKVCSGSFLPLPARASGNAGGA